MPYELWMAYQESSTALKLSTMSQIEGFAASAPRDGLLQLGDENEGRPKVSDGSVLQMFVALPVAGTVRKRLKNAILQRARAINRCHHEKS